MQVLTSLKLAKQANRYPPTPLNGAAYKTTIQAYCGKLKPTTVARVIKTTLTNGTTHKPLPKPLIAKANTYAVITTGGYPANKSYKVL